MSRVIARSAAGAIVALICISLTGCVLSDAAPAQAPSTLPPELSIEEHALKDGPDLEPLTFVPVEGTQEEILSKHEYQRASPRSPYHGGRERSRGDDTLTATTYVTDTWWGGQKIFVEVDGEVVYSIGFRERCPTGPRWGLWTYDDHWVLEVARCRVASSATVGQIIRDGVSLNKQHGYQESFGFQLLNDKPFYFLKKSGQLGISYDDREIPLGYTRVSHYQCCSGSVLNLRSSRTMVAFFAQRDGTRYYVEIGVFE